MYMSTVVLAEGAAGVLVQSSPVQSTSVTKMTARKSGSRLETEIERCRSESQWDKIPELVRQLSAKLISNGRKRFVNPIQEAFPRPGSSGLPDTRIR